MLVSITTTENILEFFLFIHNLQKIKYAGLHTLYGSTHVTSYCISLTLNIFAVNCISNSPRTYAADILQRDIYCCRYTKMLQLIFK